MNQTEHAMDFSDFMSNIQDYFQNVVLESSKNSNVLPKNFTEHFQAFATAINWKEPFIVCLYTFQIVLFVFVLFTRNYFYLQCFIFMMICGLISIAELLNDYGSKNWKQIATQDYFDEHGFFAGALFAGPLLVIGFTQLIIFLGQASSLLIKVKRREVQEFRSKQAKESKNDNVDSNDNTTTANDEDKGKSTLKKKTKSKEN